MQALRSFLVLLCVLAASTATLFAQDKPPEPSAPKSVTVPAVKEKKLPNGLTVAIVERHDVPLVTIQILVKTGASAEGADKAGLADITASMLTKGTKTRSATQIAEAIEYLGGSINSGAGWNSSFVAVTVTSDKVDQAMEILSDVILNPKFDQSELDLLKSQNLDGLTYNLKQPGFLANFVASKYSYREHPAGGTPASISSIERNDIIEFQGSNYNSSNSVIIFTGDITGLAGTAVTNKYFGKWKGSKEKPVKELRLDRLFKLGPPEAVPMVRRFLVIDLPKSGQAAVSYAKIVGGTGRGDAGYFPASVLNSVLGGGYSSRLNLEIRIKRGLSYGAGSSFVWRPATADFGTRTQTKNESAAEVVELVLDEIRKLSSTPVESDELVPRKSVLTGGFGRNLETTGGLAGAIGELYSFGISAEALNTYVQDVNGVTGKEIESFANTKLLGGDIIIVGDYSIFKDDLAKRFPDMKVDVINADDIDLSKDNLRK